MNQSLLEQIQVLKRRSTCNEISGECFLTRKKNPFDDLDLTLWLQEKGLNISYMLFVFHKCIMIKWGKLKIYRIIIRFIQWSTHLMNFRHTCFAMILLILLILSSSIAHNLNFSSLIFCAFLKVRQSLARFFKIHQHIRPRYQLQARDWSGRNVWLLTYIQSIAPCMIKSNF